jgi:hypothetical protein
MAQLGAFPVFQKIERASISAPEVLTKERERRTPWKVRNLGLSSKKDSISALSEASIKLDVLIVDTRFIIAPNSPERVKGHKRVMTVVHPAIASFIAMCGAPVSQYRILRGRGGALEASLSLGMHGNDDRIGMRFRLNSQQNFAILIRIIRMGIDANQKAGSVTILPYRHVERYAVYTGFVQEKNFIICRGEPFDDV